LKALRGHAQIGNERCDPLLCSQLVPAAGDEETLLDDLDPEDLTLNRRRWPR
jgi:hypothetical protein